MGKFYITTSIPYANGDPHMGHTLDPLYADIISRFRKQKGDDVFFLVGLDENGQKVYQTACERKMNVTEWTKYLKPKFKNFNKKLGNEYNDFIQTSDRKKHHLTAQEIWRMAEARGDIYKKPYKGLYCVGCESFKIETELEDGKCPDHLTKPEEIEEENYFFSLSKYQKFLLEYFEKNPDFVYPKTRYNEAYQMVKNGLEDISISRPKERLPWGVPVPSDDSHVMYVWFDALTCYLSGIGFAADKKKFEKYWPADLQIVGKDNNRWHSILWPAMLESASLKLPKKVFVHGYILGKGGIKMSKTIGNVIDPVEMIDEYGTDAFRYYLAAKMAPESDFVFTEEHLREVYNSDLSNGLGNLVQRVAVMIEKYLDGKIPEGHTEVDRVPFERHMDTLELHKAVEYIWSELKGLDQYIEEEKPWELFKEKNSRLDEVLGNLVASIKVLNEMLAPFMPETSKKIAKIFEGEKIKVGKPLFPRMD